MPRPNPSKVASSAILETLDEAGDDFPALVSFEWRYGGARLHGFADERDWAIVIEQFTYSPNGGINDLPLALHSFGSRLPARNQRSIWLKPIKKGPCGVLCIEDPDEDLSYYAQRLHPGATDISIHGKIQPLRRDPKRYKKLGIKLRHAPDILKAELQPYLIETYRDQIFATPRELGISLPELIRLDEWRHPNPSECPSDSRDLQMIASVLEHRDSARYKPTRANTRWNQRPKD